jgi:SnoaL-like domain
MSTSRSEVTSRDRQELTDLIVEFAWRVDHRVANSVHELVTDDVEMTLTNATMRGKPDVVDWGSRRDSVARTTSHLMMNLRFKALDADRVEVDSSSIIFRHDGLGIGKAVPWAVTEYHDLIVRQGGKWKFRSRVSNDIFRSDD